MTSALFAALFTLLKRAGLAGQGRRNMVPVEHCITVFSAGLSKGCRRNCLRFWGARDFGDRLDSRQYCSGSSDPYGTIKGEITPANAVIYAACRLLVSILLRPLSPKAAHFGRVLRIPPPSLDQIR